MAAPSIHGWTRVGPFSPFFGHPSRRRIDLQTEGGGGGGGAEALEVEVGKEREREGESHSVGPDRSLAMAGESGNACAAANINCCGRHSILQC